MGQAAAVAAAAVWAISVVLTASQSSKLDFLSLSTLRLVTATIFFLVILLPLGADADIGRMSFNDIWQLVGTGVLNLAIGDTLYIGAIVLLGVNFAYTVSLGLFALFSFVLSVIFLDETVALQTILGSLLVLGGIYVVALYGRGADQESTATDSTTDSTAVAAVGDPASALPTGPPLVQGAVIVVADGPATTLPEPDLATALTDSLRERIPGGVFGGLVLLVLAALCWAAGTVWMRDVADGFDATAVGVMRIPSAMITLAAIALLTPSSALRRRSVPLSSGWALAIAGVTGAGIGSLLFIVAVQEIGAGETAVLSSLSPLFALPLAAVVLGERITPWLLVGVSIALAGIILLSV
ncbi:MAG: Permease of the drug/metabolite transporter (DMT) superfamily [Chloroflexi bacterium]|nr:MAG: Permease of the drug/metabolite transporter (DMT) superfamily [Chloroflexota bacterium]